MGRTYHYLHAIPTAFLNFAAIKHSAVPLSQKQKSIIVTVIFVAVLILPVTYAMIKELTMKPAPANNDHKTEQSIDTATAK